MRTAIVFACLAMLAFAGCTSKPVPAPKPPDSKVMKFSELPAVQEVLVTTARNTGSGKSGHFADPGQKWNSTDVIYEGNQSLPRRRLIFGGMVDGNWFVYYEHGGRGKHQHLVAVSSNPSAPPSIFANMYASDGWTELSEIRSALKNRVLKSSDPGHCF